MARLLLPEDEDRPLLGIPGAGLLEIRPPDESQIETDKALAENYRAVQKARAEAAQAQQQPIWSLLNPVGTEELRPHAFTADTEFTPGASWGGRPVSQAFKDKVDWGTNMAMGWAGQITPRLSGGKPLELKLNPDAPGFGDRISTRTPSEVQVPDVHISPEYQVGADSFNLSGSKKADYQTKTAELIAQQPGFERFRNGNYQSVDDVHEAFTSHLEKNLHRLYQEVSATEWGPHAANWYPGANTAALDTARMYGLEPRQGAAMAARLSPGTPWDMNVAQMNRTANIVAEHSDTPMTEAMRELYRTKYEPGSLPDGKKNPDWKPKWAEGYQAINADPTKTTLAHHSGDDAGLWVRLFDESHNPNYSEYRLVNPNGTYGAAMKDRYTPNSNGNIGAAISIMRDGSLENISRELGDGHKIRSFYNDIISPHAGSDVTIDTHAMAAANLMPWGASRPEVSYGFGNSPQKPFPAHPGGEGVQWLTGAKGGAHTGSDGLYPLYAEAYRRVADDLDILPRELQSMTWEGIKGLYEPAARRGARGDAILAENSRLWREVENGNRDIGSAQSEILKRGIKEPEWWARRGAPGERWQSIDYGLSPKKG